MAAKLDLAVKSDQEIVALACAGSEAGYRELIRRYERPVFSLLYRMLRDRELAEDLSQETWVDSRDVRWLREEIRDRIRLLEHHTGEPEARRRLRTEMLRAERRMLVRLRNEGAISDDVLLNLEQELDLEALRAGAGEER